MSPAVRADDKRALPDYDGRPDEKRSAALWVPRILAAPLYLTSEFVLRRPLGALTRDVERADEGSARSRFRFTPIVVADVGFKPWFGLHVKREDTFVRGNALHAQAAFGGIHTLLLGLADEASIDDRAALSAFGTLTRRDDAIFHGLGPRSSPDARIRYGLDRLETGLGFQVAIGASSSFRSVVGLRGTRFTDPSELSTHDYALVFQGAALTLDTRRDPSRPTTAARLELDGEHAIETDATRDARFVRWGAEATLSLDLTGKQRVLALSTAVRFVDPIRGDLPPVTELVTLGGDRFLRGFLFGRLVGQSAFVTAVTYEWPIWVWLDGLVAAEAGDVFGAHLDGFAPKLLRTSFTAGMRATGTDATVELLGGIGTEPIADGMRISSGRFVLAITRRL